MRTLLAALIGFGSGVASGAFGIGGALLSTPGIRVLLATPAMTAVGTTLPVIVPTAMVGLMAYIRGGHVRFKLAAVAAAAGGVSAVLGAYTTEYLEGELLLILTAGLIFVLALRMLPAKPSLKPPRIPQTVPVYLAVGAVSGFLSGLLGLGGGLILVPAFTVLFRLPVKTALGTSLAVVAAQAIPGTVVHSTLGNIDWRIAGGLFIGVVPGARIGSKLAVAAEDTKLRLLVGLGMAVLALAFGLGEVRELLR